MALILLLVVMVIIPIGVFIFLFHKQEKKVWFGIQLGAQILMIPFDSVVNINASWRYLSEEDYEQVKNEMLGREVAETYDENYSVIYRIAGEW